MSTDTIVKRTCPKCGKMLKIPSKFVGLKVECNHCKAHFVVKPPQAGGGAQLADEEERIPVDEELEGLKTGSSTEIPQTTAPGPSTEEPSSPASDSPPYMVAKVHMGGRMAHSNLEDTLNKYAADGWSFVYAVHHGTELFVIFRRSS